MADTMDLARAQKVYETLCAALDHDDWHYKKDEEALTIECGARGEDLPMELLVKVDVDRMLVMLLSKIPFQIAEDKRLDVAVAVSVINNMLVDGSFDYDVASGRIFFRMTNSYIESNLGEEMFRYLVYCSCKTIDSFNDKLLMLSKGVLSLEQFIQSVKN